MKRILVAAVGAAVAIGTAVFAVGQAVPVKADSDLPTYEEFRETSFQRPDGTWITNGDQPMKDEAELYETYERFINEVVQIGDHHHDHDHGDLTVHLDSNRNWAVWGNAQVGSLTYCVSNAFGSNKTAVVNAMAAAQNPWENASSAVNFQYVPAQDANCNSSNPNVIFPVVPAPSNAPYLASAFFPNFPKAQRVVDVHSSALNSSWGLTNIMVHELGHTLGFRHEHTRPEARPMGSCNENSAPWQAVTAYDRASVMHYPQCNGAQGLNFSATDAQGTAQVYGN